ncbi:hypothetical protein HK100_005453 [Physocladia obscura]|uniref:Apple domain-containing protein n=1 Tax=Physocladia obscura TaxID=109957 RepID=A0AAD5XIU6_9FUNG|nr:hypothetical protein HK100_005453 [Physocladia obscura]
MLTALALLVASTVSTQTTYTFPTGQDWGYDCDYPGGDITNLATEASLCGPACQAFAGCEYFVWTDVNGGTCWLKDYSTTGVVSAATGVCGFLSPASPNYGFNDATTLQWANDCGWAGTVLSSTSHPDGTLCGGECLALSACTHFQFNDTSLTCDFFDSTATGPIYNAGGACGFTTPNPAVVVASTSDTTTTITATTTTDAAPASTSDSSPASASSDSGASASSVTTISAGATTFASTTVEKCGGAATTTTSVAPAGNTPYVPAIISTYGSNLLSAADVSSVATVVVVVALMF